uniref:Uncharacterized protein n=1 Tax=Anguilla anguilla TaxID=7936 RepID=A0A0E9S4L7_ANGAN
MHKLLYSDPVLGETNTQFSRRITDHKTFHFSLGLMMHFNSIPINQK